MRIYEDENNEEIFTVICNKCKKEMNMKNSVVREGVFSVDYSFGYFSEKDRETHSFDLCEACYDRMVREFMIPPQVAKVVEVL